MQPQTPGVYTIEKNAFSNSVVEVATAIPAFVGYTQQATYEGKDLTNIPTRVESFKQFQDYFGGAFMQTFDLSDLSATASAGNAAAPATDTLAIPASPISFALNQINANYSLTPSGDSLQYLYSAIHLFYLNGGSTCYIVSIGDYFATPDADHFTDGIDLLIYEQDPTMLLCPDALRLNQDGYNEVVQHMLMHCADMQSRVALFDVYRGAVTKPDDVDDRIATFRDGVGQNNLKYGIAYFPWVRTSLLAPTQVSFLNLTQMTLEALRDLLNKPLPPQAAASTAPTASTPTPALPAPITAAAVVEAAAKKAADDAPAANAIAVADAKAVAAAATAAKDPMATLATVTAAAQGSGQSHEVEDAIANKITPAPTPAALVKAIADAVVTAAPADPATLANAKAVAAAADAATQPTFTAQAVADAAAKDDPNVSAALAAQTLAKQVALAPSAPTNTATTGITNATATTLTNAIAAQALTATALTDAKNKVQGAQDDLTKANGNVSDTATKLLDAYNNLSSKADDNGFRDALSSAQDAATAARDAATEAASALAAAQQHLAQATAADAAATKIIAAARTGIAAGSLPTSPASAVDGKPYLVPALPNKAGPQAPENIFDQAIKLLQSNAMDDMTAKNKAGIFAPVTDRTLLDRALQDKRDAINNSLRTLFPAYSLIMTALARYLNTLPVAPAMAGVYTAIDNSRGVWKAPANVSLNAVVAPTVSLSDQGQADLNIDAVTGKSVNAIRSFKGLGTLVWGARTLDGNSKDWRFINVRRTMIMIEQSVKLACRSYVFEPNDANTWTNVKSMISSFLFNLWKEGALAGAVPTDAYSVAVGLGSTMTPDDILDGFMNVTVLVAIVRPAEFIVLTFQQQQQKS